MGSGRSSLPERARSSTTSTRPATSRDRVASVSSSRHSSRGCSSLAKLGYRVGQPETGTPTGRSSLIDQSGGKGAALLDRLTKDLGLVDPNVLAGGDTNSGAVVVELGEDAANLVVDVPRDDGAP